MFLLLLLLLIIIIIIVFFSDFWGSGFRASDLFRVIRVVMGLLGFGVQGCRVSLLGVRCLGFGVTR